MERTQIESYPALNESLWVMQALESRDRFKADLEEVEKTLQTAIDTIQKNCQHDWNEKREYDKNIASCYKTGGNIGYGMDVLISKTCKNCGFEETKPKGSNTEVCQACWTPGMKYVQTIPGQGERQHIYECQNPKCFYGSWDT